MRTSLSVTMAAPAPRIFDLVRDLGRWPEMLPHYRSVTIESRYDAHVVARMVAIRRFGPVSVPVTWRAEQWADAADPGDLRLFFRHVRGITAGMNVVWHIRADEGGTRVSIEHDFRRPLPLLGSDALPAFVDRFFTRHIARRTLAAFRALAEGS